MFRPNKLYALVAMSAIAVSAASAQVTIGTIGNAGTGSTYPFGFSGGYTKFQQVYSSTLFTSPLSIGTVSFYSKPGTQILQQGTYNFYFNRTATAPANVNTGNPSANETGPRQFFGTYTIGANVDAPDVLSFAGATYFYDPTGGNLVLDVDFTPIGNLVNSGRAAFDRYFDVQGTTLVATSSDAQAFFGTTAGSRGSGLVTTFGPSTTVPEPSTIAFVAAGLAAVFVLKRRRTPA